MKKFSALLLCLCLLLGTAACKEETVQNNVPENDLRTVIRAEDVTLNVTADEAGAQWFSQYGAQLKGGVTAEAVYVDSFTTDALSSGFTLSFSKWKAGTADYLIVEAVYSDGSRRLADLYELTSVARVNTLGYAYERLKEDARFSGALAGELTNLCSDGVREYNISEAVPQSARFELLAEQSIRAGKVLYGKTEQDGCKSKLEIHVDARGLGTAKGCNNPADGYANGAYLMNYSYWAKYDDNGSLIVLNRKNRETVLCNAVKSEDENYCVPEIFDVYDDERMIYTVYSLTGVRGFGVYNSADQSNTIVANGSYPIALWEETKTLYIQYLNEDGTYGLGTVSLDDPSAPAVPVPGSEERASVYNGTAQATLSPDGTLLVLLERTEDGMAQIEVLNATTGALVAEHHITGRFCDPAYIGFADENTIMVLSEKRFLCDEYLFLISVEDTQ